MTPPLSDSDLAAMVAAILRGDLAPEVLRALSAAIEKASGTAPTFLPQAEAARRLNVTPEVVRGRVRRAGADIRTGLRAGRLLVHLGDLQADLQARPPRQTSSDQFDGERADSAMLAALAGVQGHHERHAGQP